MAAKKINLAEFISQRTKNERLLGAIAGGFILFAVVQGLIIGPILSKISDIDSDIFTKHDEIRRDRRIISFKGRILEEYSKFSPFLDAKDKSSEEIVAKLLKKIESTAVQQQVTVKDIRPGDTESKAQFQVYKTGIDCEATLPNLLSFMNTLEQSDYLFQIRSYSLAPKSKGADVLKASMEIVRYLIPAEKVDARELAAVKKAAAASKPAVQSISDTTTALPLPEPQSPAS